MIRKQIIIALCFFSSINIHSAANTTTATVKRITHDPYAWGKQRKTNINQQDLVAEQNIAPISNLPIVAPVAFKNNIVFSEFADSGSNSSHANNASFPVLAHYINLIRNETNPEALVNTLKEIPKDLINEYNDEGKTIAHYFFRVGRKTDPMQQAIDLGVDFTKQSICPDTYCGASIAHDLAGTLKSKNHSWGFKSDQYHRLRKLWDIDKGAHFDKRSYPNNNSVWDLLQASLYLPQFLQSIPENCVPKRFQHLVSQPNVTQQFTQSQIPFCASAAQSYPINNAMSLPAFSGDIQSQNPHNMAQKVLMYGNYCNKLDC